MERFRENRQSFRTDRYHFPPRRIRVRRQNQVESLERFFECPLILEQFGVKESELLPVKSIVDRFGTPEIEHPQGSVLDQEISGVRISMEYAQRVDLVPVKVPKRLANPVAFRLLRFCLNVLSRVRPSTQSMVRMWALDQPA